MEKEIRYKAYHKPTNRIFWVYGFNKDFVFEDSLDGVGTSETLPAKREDCILLQDTGLKDKWGVSIFEGDILFCKEAKGWCDGYLKKKYPTFISAYLVVEYYNGGFEFIYKTAIPEHRFADEEMFYRSIGYSKSPMSKGAKYYNPETQTHDIAGDGITCRNVEDIGDIYQDSELLLMNDKSK